MGVGVEEKLSVFAVFSLSPFHSIFSTSPALTVFSGAIPDVLSLLGWEVFPGFRNRVLHHADGQFIPCLPHSQAHEAGLRYLQVPNCRLFHDGYSLRICWVCRQTCQYTLWTASGICSFSRWLTTSIPASLSLQWLVHSDARKKLLWCF